ncbi:hypothetical protein J2X04_002847 [Lysobacter niabensis]|uniref:Uncharacterized protein n=1 Tax=Agrilutibacter niabensis TaxID=380628 RepID=A0ABU1VSK1_9GAMM|nr:hypothetical protein [Lysobacter niabensis]MDR7100466.1 hypothetical protein [Lysobacter niabensis]
MVGLKPEMGDTTYPYCHSNIIVRPGPAGWGAPGFVSTATAQQADQAIDAVKPVFVAKCRAATGREIAGTIRSAWNQTDRDDSDLDSWQAGPGSTAVLLD